MAQLNGKYQRVFTNTGVLLSTYLEGVKKELEEARIYGQKNMSITLEGGHTIRVIIGKRWYEFWK